MTSEGTRKKARRGRGEGSVYFNGRYWVASASTGYDENGKRRRRVVYGETKAEALAKLSTENVLARAGVPLQADRATVKAFLAGWLETVAKPDLRPSTFTRYESLLQLHAYPQIGGVRLARIQPEQVQALYAAMTNKRTGKPLSGRTREFMHVILREAFENAVTLGKLRVNPCTRVKRPRPDTPEMAAWNREQAGAFLRAAEGDRLEAAYVLALMTGMREGELLGLQWDDVDLAAAKLHVRRTVQAVKGKLHVGPPKTKKSRRTIDLDGLAVHALRQHRAALVAFGYAGSPWVFPGALRPGVESAARKPGPMWPDTLVDRFKAIAARARTPDKRKLPALSFHGLRHTHATLALQAGTNVKVLSERLGHSNVTITLKIYAHALPSMQADAAARMEHLFADVPRREGLDWLHSGHIPAPRRAGRADAKVRNLRKVD